MERTGIYWVIIVINKGSEIVKDAVEKRLVIDSQETITFF